MELTGYLRVLRRYWRSVVASLLAGLALAAVFTLVSRPTYTATTSIFLAVKSASTAGELSAGSNFAQNQVDSYAKVARTPIVLQPVIDGLRLPLTAKELADKVTATVPSNTATVDISVTSGEPELTAQIAAEIGRQLVKTVEQLSPPTADGSETVKATIITPASVPSAPTSPKALQNIGLGLLLGLLVGAGQAILRDNLDSRVRSEHDVSRVSEASMIGLISFDEDAAQHPLISEVDPHSPRAEAYRRLRTNLQFLKMEGQANSIVITSSIEGEGKTTTAINIASTLADAGESVLLIDADLRRPKVAGYLSLENAAGLTTVLIGRAGLTDVVQPYGRGNFHVLTAGNTPPNPAELLGSTAMERLLAEAAARYDVVLIDAPPLLPVTDAAVLSRFVGGSLVVVGSREVRRPQLAAALATLKAVDARILGLVLNKIRRDDEDRYSYGYSYRQGYGHGESAQITDAPQRVLQPSNAGSTAYRHLGRPPVVS